MVAFAPLPARAATPPEELTPKQRREVSECLNQFRRAQAEPEKRTEATDRLIAIGGPAAAQLLVTINKELAPLQARYRAAFLQATQAVLRERLKDHDPEEIDSLREKVLALSKDGSLTKEKIKAQGDPAMATLDELLMASPVEVHEKSPTLKPQRETLLELGKHWRRAVDYLAEYAPKTGEGPRLPPRVEDALKANEDLSALLAIAKSDLHRKILVANADLEPKLPPEEARGIRDLNRIRLLLGLKPLRIDLALCDAARDHSQDMVTKGFFGHESPVPGKKTPWERAKRFGTSAGSENIAAGAGTGPGANQQWFHSPGHHRNMLAGHSRVGLGQYRNTWTQMFGG